MTYTTESINKTIDLCREEMAKSDALPPTLKQLMELILQILMFQILRCDAMIPAKLDGAIENSSHSCMSIPSSIWLSSKGAVISISPPRRLST